MKGCDVMDAEEKKEIFEALAKVKEICQFTDHCYNCPFSTGKTYCCGFSGYGFFPDTWELDIMNGVKE